MRQPAAIEVAKDTFGCCDYELEEEALFSSVILRAASAFFS